MELGRSSARSLTLSLKGKASLRRKALTWLVVGCVVVVAACSSDSNSDDATSEEADAQSSGEQANAVDPGADDQNAGDQEQPNGDAGSDSDVNEDRVCDVIEPVVDEMVAATSLDVELDGEISEPNMSELGCDLRLVGPDVSLTVVIARAPAILSSVDTFLGTMVDSELVGPVPSLGSDAQLMRETMSPSAFTAMSSNGRVWQVSATDNLAPATGEPSADIEAVAVSISEVLRSRLDG